MGLCDMLHNRKPQTSPALLSGARAYRYLEQSIARFPAPAEFVAMLSAAGFIEASARPLTFGVCCLFTATVPIRAAQ